MKINRSIPDYLERYTDRFGEIGCLKEKHIVVDTELTKPDVYPHY